MARLTAKETVAKGAVIEYDEAEYAVEDEPLLTARANAEELGGTEPVAPATGAALRFFATAIAARSVVEIGTGCGSSGIWLLRGMRPGGVLTSVDTEPEYHRLARKAFTQAGFATNQARLILGRALDVLPRLSDGAYDLVFCDADQASYPEYLTASLRLLRAGGIVMRVPLEGGGRLVVELSVDEAAKLGDALQAAVGSRRHRFSCRWRLLTF